MHLKRGAILGVLAAIGFGGSAYAEPFQNRTDAARAGDPAGTAPARPAPTRGLFRGEELTFAQIKARLRGGPMHCQTAADGQTQCEDGETGARASAARRKARAAYNCAFTHQVHYKWGHWNNDSYGFEGRTYWQNLPGYMNDDTSSYRMGNRAGHMAEHINGGGYWYPGDTTTCAEASITDQIPHWDNRISSGWRSLS